jgi:tricarballylate dehydrogenase
MARVTENRADPDLVELLVRRSKTTLMWLKEKGVRFVPIYGRQAFKVNNRFKFWGGLTVESWGGGPGLVSAETEAATRRGIHIAYQARAMSLLHDDNGVHGLVARHEGKTQTIRCKSVVLANGGFESNPEWRTRYLGPGWDLAKVRGTRFNTGDGIRAATGLDVTPWAGIATHPNSVTYP